MPIGNSKPQPSESQPPPPPLCGVRAAPQAGKGPLAGTEEEEARRCENRLASLDREGSVETNNTLLERRVQELKREARRRRVVWEEDAEAKTDEYNMGVKSIKEKAEAKRKGEVVRGRLVGLVGS